MKEIWYLECVNLFKIICPHQYTDYKKTHTLDSYKKKDYVYFDEDDSKSVYLINSGKVKLGYYTEDGKEIVKSILTKGDLFGEKAILGEDKRNEFAQSVDNQTSICPIGVQAMHELMRNNKTFSFSVYKFIGFKFKKLERRLQLLLFKDTKTRLVEFLDELCIDYGYNCPKTGDHVIKHPYTQKDIASLIGTSRPTLNILLNELREENYIDFRRKEIRILKNAS